MAKCPKCGNILKPDDYVLEDFRIPTYFTMGNRAVPIFCKHCETLLGFLSG
jgi:predicted nucleic-acid-binding Zn-ribbon protein